jgi:NAD(P)-dependent dehydrogenase (short-subunit alcohol dehydrogenase family)
VLQNNAAIAYYPGQLENMSTREKLSLTYNTNDFGSASMITAFLPLLERSAHPRIVNVSSGLGSLTLMVDPTSKYKDAHLLVSRGTFLMRWRVILNPSGCRSTTRPSRL